MLVIGKYESSPKEKCREGMCGAFQWIAELQIPSRDRVSVSPRSCVDFVRCTQAEIVCQFCRDRVSISPGDRLGYVGDRLRFWENLHRGGELLGEEVVEEVDEEKKKRIQNSAKQVNSSSSRSSNDRLQ